MVDNMAEEQVSELVGFLADIISPYIKETFLKDAFGSNVDLESSKQTTRYSENGANKSHFPSTSIALINRNKGLQKRGEPKEQKSSKDGRKERAVKGSM